ncbi:hypothetical protein V6N12_020034 [Hibiscus sabdariffa]|uniref:Uncharacterized protein n=1 Tax=Hibiscus sabdariffa TaxID=183260 RepID=A0ABR2B6C4_9ROSI
MRYFLEVALGALPLQWQHDPGLTPEMKIDLPGPFFTCLGNNLPLELRVSRPSLIRSTLTTVCLPVFRTEDSLTSVPVEATFVTSPTWLL